MKGIAALDDEEIVHELSVGQESLSPNPGLARLQIGGLNLWNQSLQSADKKRLAERTLHLHPTFAHMLAGQLPKARVGESVTQVASRKVRLAVSFAFEGQNGIGTGMDRAIDHAGEMHPEKWEIGIWNRVNEGFDQMALLRNQGEVLAAERNDLCTGIGAGSGGNAITVQTAAVDHEPRFDGSPARFEDVPLLVAPDVEDANSRLNGPIALLNQLGVLCADFAVTYDSSRRDVNAGNTSDVGFDFTDLFGAQSLNHQPILYAPLTKILQARQLVLFCGDDDFSTDLVFDVMLAAELHQRSVALAGKARFKAAGFVVNAGMDYSAVAAGLVKRQIVLLLKDDDFDAMLPPRQRHGYCQADDSAANNRAIVFHETESLADDPNAGLDNGLRGTRVEVLERDWRLAFARIDNIVIAAKPPLATAITSASTSNLIPAVP